MGECFVCSGNTNDWLLVKLAELGLGCSRCWAASLFTESSFFLSDTAGDDGDGDGDAAFVLSPAENGDGCGTACG